ncbi:MAG TPA: glycosyltransferase family 2 protein, partial [Patescibacteria group bacterium]|nr:glycosyltransferase family 2 protein [Patescibacteria group bacterium]
GATFWFVFLGSIWLSINAPVAASIFIIAFDFYFLLKAANNSMHLTWSYRMFKLLVRLDWGRRLEALNHPKQYIAELRKQAESSDARFARNYYNGEAERVHTYLAKHGSIQDYKDFYHLVVLPFVDETFEVLDSTFHALSRVAYPLDRILIVLAAEERAGLSAIQTSERVQEKYGTTFARLFITFHPDGLPGEIKGKSANASYAVKSILPDLEAMGVPIEKVLVANLDSDTVVHPQYFARVMYEFLTVENPYRKSFQPITVFNNNIWDSPALIRVVSVSSAFWLFTESSRTDRLRTFSSHSMSLKALTEVGFWKPDIVNEDAYIYWQSYIHYKGDYHVVPLFIPVSMDTCLAPTFIQTLKNQYKQKRRWAYNVEYYPHMMWKLITLEAPWHDKARKIWQYVEGNFNWATASLLITLGGLMPLYLGGSEFLNSVTAFQLPFLTKWILRISMIFLIFSIYINHVLLPPRPSHVSVWKSITMYLQWFLVPITSILFGSLPAIEAQTRLMMGWYLEFFVTPKARKGENTGLSMKEMQASHLDS